MPDTIETKQDVLGGMPVFHGTRIPIERVMALFVQGYNSFFATGLILSEIAEVR